METIDRLVQQTCQKMGDKSALREKIQGQWQEVSYSKLDEQACGIAAGLLDAGLETGRQVAILAAPSSLWVGTYLGILKAGGVAVPIDKELKGSEIRHILNDCQANFLFTEPIYLETLKEIFSGLPDLQKIILLRENRKKTSPGPAFPSSKKDHTELSREFARLVERYQIDPHESQRFEQLIQGYADNLVAAPKTTKTADDDKKTLLQRLGRGSQSEEPVIISLETFFGDAQNLRPSPRKSGDIAMILYTSGTTGRSKGAMLSHGNVISNVQSAMEIFSLKEDMRTLSFLPINHVYELVCGILLPLTVGGTVSFAESLKQLGNNLSEVKPSFLLGVPAVFQRLHDRIMKGIEEKTLARWLFNFGPTRTLVSNKVRRNLGDGTIFVSGGAALDPAVAEGLTKLGVDVYQGYGITETSPIVAAERPGCKKLGTVGLPLPGIEVRIDAPNEEGVGEIWVRGPNVMQGYFNNPRATAEVLTDGWYHTGDLGFIDDQGILSIRGRVKNLIVTPNGKNVYPEEVENELIKSPFIAEVMVYGHKVSPSAEEVHALIVPDHENLDIYAQRNESRPLNEADVEELIRQEVVKACRQLADFKRVKKFTLRDEELPKTTTRKIKRFVVEADIPAANSSRDSATE